MKKTFLAAFLCVMIVGGIAFAEKAPWQNVVVGKGAECERLAVVDLQRYLGQATGRLPRILSVDEWQRHPVAAVIVGVPETNGLIPAGNSDALGDEGYRLEQTTLRGKKVIVAEGKTPAGAVNAAYGLLRELGFGFYLGSEAIPDSLPPALPVSPVVRVPNLAIRGVLPWYNFFNSPTTWDPVDHRAFVDQLIRLGANFVGFHTYDSEPFGAVNEGGEMRYGDRLLSTATATWGTRPLATTEFPFGLDKLYPYDYFGADTTRMPGATAAERAIVIQREQDIMRDALEYASRRGLHTCIGFEMTGDPFVAASRDIFLKRINRLLDQYPVADMIWLWQPEAEGAQGFIQQPGANSPLALYAAARREAFKRVVERTRGERPLFQDTPAGKQARAMEGARMEQFAQLAQHAIDRRARKPRLIISGWGGEDRILSAEYYDGLDKLLPKDVIFSSLDMINIKEKVDSIYGELPADRERWPILWLECDGDQWHNQPYVHTLEKTMADIRRGGSQGVLGIHWRTRDVEENFGYIVDSAWNAQLTAEDWFRDMAARCYGPAIGAQMAVIQSELDKLGYRWVGGAGQNECAGFSWGPGDEAKRDRLSALRKQAEQLLSIAGRGETRLRWLLAHMEFVLQYDKVEHAVVEATSLLGKAQSSGDEKQTLAEKGAALLNDKRFASALHAYAERVTTRGEYGVLATINTKAVVAWNDLKAQFAKILEKQDELVKAWSPEPEILLPRLVTSVTLGADLTLMPVLLDGGDAWVHYRAIGAGKWVSEPMPLVRGWVRRAVIPAVTESMELKFSFSPDPRKPAAYGPVAITAFPPVTATSANTQKEFAATPAIQVSAKAGAAVPVELTWEPVPGADFYRVSREGKNVAEPATTFFPDVPMKLDNVYEVEAVCDGNVVARSEAVAFTCKNVPVPEAVEIKTFTNRAGVFLQWPTAKALFTALYRIERRAKGAQAWKEIARISASTDEGVYRDAPEPGQWDYGVTPVNAAGVDGPPTVVAVAYKPAAPVAPALDLPLTAQPEGCRVNGGVTFGPEGAQFTNGTIVFPHQPWMDLGAGLTLDFEFKLERMGEMPVLICHGVWQGDGWFVQILGNTLIVRTPTGDARGPIVEAGKWYKVRFVFDGIRVHLAIDGKWLEQAPQVIRPVSNPRNLILGNYEMNSTSYIFPGTLRNVRIYNDVLLK